MAIEVTVPDIGDFTDVPVIGILVSVGDVIAEEDPIVELESDKATMEVPSPAAGKVAEIKVSEGDTVSEGSLLILLEGEGASVTALHRSWLNIPHVTHNEEADITELDGYRRELDAQAKQGGYRVTLLSFAIKASVSALKSHWEVNSSIHPDGDKLIKKDYYNIGFATDTPNGLVVPVIKDADRKGIALAGPALRRL